MSIKKVILVIGLCLFSASCSTQRVGLLGEMSAVGNQKVFSNDPYHVGMRYLTGYGAPQSDSKAFYYLSQAASQGNAFAQNEIAYMYAAGKGVSQNDVEALRWYQQAAENNLASAQYNLGLMYLYGIGTELNKAQGLKWLRKSAEHGFAPAEQFLQKYSS